MGMLVIIGSAEALPILCVRYFRWERERERDTERERERERRKWRHHCRAKIGDEHTQVSLAKNSHNWRWAYTFPCQKFALFVSPFTLPVSPFTERSPLWRWNSQWVHTFHCQKFLRPLCSPSFKWHEPHDEWSKTQDKWSNPAQSYFVLPIEKLNQINTKNYWKKKKRLCVRWLGVINLTWENLQIAKHKSGRRSFSLADWFVLCDL